MAFKMKGSPHKRGEIQGTRAYKRSIAKAISQQQQPVVAQTRTQADANLIQAASDLATSYSPGRINYELNMPDIDDPSKSSNPYWQESYDEYVTRMEEAGAQPISRDDWVNARNKDQKIEKKEDPPKRGCTDAAADNYCEDCTEDDGSCVYTDPSTEVVTVDGADPSNIMSSREIDWSQAPPVNTQERVDWYRKHNLALDETTSAVQYRSPANKRDDRIWKNAIKGGKVQENMLKSGYLPPNLR